MPLTRLKKVAKRALGRWGWKELDALVVSDRWLPSARATGSLPPGDYKWCAPGAPIEKGYRIAWDKDRRARIRRRVKNKDGLMLIYKPHRL